MKASEFDNMFDEGGPVLSALDMSKAQRPGLVQRRVNVDIPAWIIAGLDREAERLGVTRQSVIKFWLAEKVQHMQPGHPADRG